MILAGVGGGAVGGGWGVAKLDYMNPRITASPRRPQGDAVIRGISLKSAGHLKNEWDRAAATRTAQDTIESSEAFSIPPGSTASLTYAVFVEINERVKYGEIVDAVLGASNRIEVPSTVPVP